MRRALVGYFVRSPYELANLRGEAATKLVLFVHDFVCSSVEQLPVQHVVAAAGHDKRVRREIADQVNQVACRGVVWHGDDDRASLVDARMFQNVSLCCIAEVGLQTVLLCDFDDSGIP